MTRLKMLKLEVKYPENADNDMAALILQYLEEIFRERLVPDLYIEKSRALLIEDYLLSIPKNDENDLFVTTLKNTFERILNAISVHKIDTLNLAFNGSKDCSLLLYLYAAALDATGHDMSLVQINAVFFDVYPDSPEVREHVLKMKDIYNFKLTIYQGCIKEALNTHLSNNPSHIAILMGSRETQHSGKFLMSSEEWTSNGWPLSLRLFPIFRWSDSHVDKAIIGLDISYLKYHDQRLEHLKEQADELSSCHSSSADI
uniref:PAPS_reduct domain-containing protein n=1 Tax=Rhabditophanes sp. KR3021 TaxID=114890 RepID=A0AC35TPK3_9BILA